MRTRLKDTQSAGDQEPCRLSLGSHAAAMHPPKQQINLWQAVICVSKQGVKSLCSGCPGQLHRFCIRQRKLAESYPVLSPVCSNRRLFFSFFTQIRLIFLICTKCFVVSLLSLPHTLSCISLPTPTTQIPQRPDVLCTAVSPTPSTALPPNADTGTELSPYFLHFS